MKRRNFLGGAAALIPALASGSISPRADSATLDSNNRIVSTNAAELRCEYHTRRPTATSP
jgi:hypothetical protein